MSINTRAKLVIPITTSHPELGWDSNRKVPGMTRTGRYEALDVEVPNNRMWSLRRLNVLPSP